MYSENIGREYCGKPYQEYLSGRSAVLSRMAGLEYIYHDPEIAEERDALAKANLVAELKNLAALLALYE